MALQHDETGLFSAGWDGYVHVSQTVLALQIDADANPSIGI
jgi:hypothetical protein